MWSMPFTYIHAAYIHVFLDYLYTSLGKETLLYLLEKLSRWVCHGYPLCLLQANMTVFFPEIEETTNAVDVLAV